MRYYCENCGRFFGRPIIIEERYGLAGPGQLFRGCPHCRVSGLFREEEDTDE